MTDDTFVPNKDRDLDITVDGTRYLRLPVKTRLITSKDDIVGLVKEYAVPHLTAGDLLFISEKILCVTQNRMVPIKDITTSPLARLLSRQVKNHVGTPQFRGLGHGTAPAMQLLIEEAGVPRVLFATMVSALTRPLGLKGAFYYLCGKRAKSIDCPMSWTLEPYTEYAKRAPLEPDAVARKIRDIIKAETVIVDANYRGAFSLGKSSRAITEKFIQKVLRDNPAGQDSEMTPFLIIRNV